MRKEIGIIPQPVGRYEVWNRNGTTRDIMAAVVRADAEPETRTSTTALANKLCGNTLQATCHNIYKYLRTLTYKEDEPGMQIIPTLSQVIYNRHRVDCKGMALITGGILQNLGVNYFIRFARYADPTNGSTNTEVSHVYVVVPTAGGKYFTIDGTIPTFTEPPNALQVYDYKGNTTKPIGINGTPSIGKWKPFKDVQRAFKEFDFAENATHFSAAAAQLPLREAFKTLVQYNYFGLASVMNYTKNHYPDQWKKIRQQWFVIGGNPDSLNAFIDKGKTRAPKQVAPALVNNIKGIQKLIDQGNYIYYNKISGIHKYERPHAIGYTGAEIAGIIVACATLLTAMVPYLTKNDIEGKAGAAAINIQYPNNTSLPPSPGITDFLKANALPLGAAAALGLYFIFK